MTARGGSNCLSGTQGFLEEVTSKRGFEGRIKEVRGRQSGEIRMLISNAWR